MVITHFQVAKENEKRSKVINKERPSMEMIAYYQNFGYLKAMPIHVSQYNLVISSNVYATHGDIAISYFVVHSNRRII